MNKKALQIIFFSMKYFILIELKDRRFRQRRKVEYLRPLLIILAVILIKKMVLNEFLL